MAETIRHALMLLASAHVCLCPIYTVNHKKRDTLFLTITLAKLDQFFNSFYIILIEKKFYVQL